MTTARDVREAEQIARQNALNLRHNAPPPAFDLVGHRHAIRLAVAWEGIAAAHRDRAAEIDEQRDEPCGGAK